jgi:hypothetical protein
VRGGGGVKLREDITEGNAVTVRWLGWGDIKDNHGELIGSYMFIQLPSYKMVRCFVSDKYVMGKLTIGKLCRKRNGSWLPEKYIFEYWPI